MESGNKFMAHVHSNAQSYDIQGVANVKEDGTYILPFKSDEAPFARVKINVQGWCLILREGVPHILVQNFQALFSK